MAENNSTKPIPMNIIRKRYLKPFFSALVQTFPSKRKIGSWFKVPSNFFNIEREPGLSKNVNPKHNCRRNTWYGLASTWVLVIFVSHYMIHARPPTFVVKSAHASPEKYFLENLPMFKPTYCHEFPEDAIRYEQCTTISKLYDYMQLCRLGLGVTGPHATRPCPRLVRWTQKKAVTQSRRFIWFYF